MTASRRTPTRRTRVPTAGRSKPAPKPARRSSKASSLSGRRGDRSRAGSGVPAMSDVPIGDLILTMLREQEPKVRAELTAMWNEQHPDLPASEAEMHFEVEAIDGDVVRWAGWPV